MFVSRPVVHPVEAPPLREGGNNAPRVRMKDVQGMAGTPGGLVLRLFQFLSAVVSLCVMVTISDFYSVTAFCYLVVAVSLQSLWSLSLAIMDIYALLVRRSLRNSGIISVFTVGDGKNLVFPSEKVQFGVLKEVIFNPYRHFLCGFPDQCCVIPGKFNPFSSQLTDMSNILLQITSTLTFSAACASAGITVLIENDMDRCAMNPCTRFETATAMAFISWFAVSPSFFLNFWSLASR
ncbi:CASP-like protein 5A1 [Vitis vinifera]|uniref:CASP-like protein n=1 Tax=Vitis vinifera TaxID=29760 RepID=A0A438H6J7_VITVI|nr:CASP-like protein 5A1 [Vitis vinifera]